ncbi:larval cuticle protein A2B-like [Glossina fuscipes]|uniref:Larval cuticle protein A2B-like n=1 Tax=Glossina fuscipes TaxID=7396 RepID=A0A9C6DTA3_9MUSC|nr:larval cuticle protein A2B-like [Glossina fuscipes]KAI9581426.1 hypothetical protein GQX74_012751 [Glossina fuscipes]
MRFLINTFLLISIFGWASAGYLSHGHATSYASMVKHEVPVKYEWADKHVHHVHHDHHDYKPYHVDVEHDYYSHPKYEFEYGVKDLKTGDIKKQWETRDGDLVKGTYSLKEADGTTRVVDYKADKHHGFNAVVKQLGHVAHSKVYEHADVPDYHYGHGHADSYAHVKYL